MSVVNNFFLCCNGQRKFRVCGAGLKMVQWPEKISFCVAMARGNGVVEFIEPVEAPK